MSRRTWQERIEDIVAVASEAQGFAAGMSEADFAADTKTLYAVAYAFTVMGEAARHIPEQVQRAFPAVPWSTLRAMRNRVVHEYFRIDATILWETLRQDIPRLVSQLRDVLGQEAGETSPDAP